MLTELRLQNFRGFYDHKIPLQSTTIIVGRNNAGKSTIVEALRLVSIVTTRYKNLNFSAVPNWLNIPYNYRGVAPSLKGMEFNFDSIFHHYHDPPAIITATFDTKHTITIYIGLEGKLHAVIMNPNGTPIATRTKAKSVNLPLVSILPQVGPLAREETVLNPDYIRRTMSSHLAPLHFRNQINVQYELFREFKQLAESTWPGLRIEELDGKSLIEENQLSIIVHDMKFPAEISWMGHGLQIWLQIMWFLTRTKDNKTIILDEPDVYMHADLQRKLVRLLRGRNQQTIIATHSIEIMAEVEPNQILIIDRDKQKSEFASSLPAVQKVIDNIGGIHNLQLARLWTARRCLLVEGKDMTILKHFQNTLFPDSQEPFDIIPHMSIGGWGGWNNAIGTSMFLKNAADEDITTFCVLDSDYHIAEEKSERLKQAKRKGVQLHIWARKEIENYLLIPEAIQRVISSKIKNNDTPPSVNEIITQIDKIAEQFKDKINDALVDEYYHRNKGSGAGKATQKAREHIGDAWKTYEGRFAIVSGKAVISSLSEWSQKKFKVSFSTNIIAKEMKKDEMPAEVTDIITAIENNQTLGY